MTSNRPNDEQLLIDYHLGACEEDDRKQVEARLSEDSEFADLSENVSHAFAALSLAPETDPPADLTARTLARIDNQRQLNGFLAREEIRRQGRPTFSFRELGAIAAAALVLVAIFIPVLREQRRQSFIVECASNVGRIGTAMNAYAAANGGRLPYASVDAVRWLPGKGGEAEDAPVASNSQALFRLVAGKYEDPTAFQCPARGGDSFVVQAGMIDFPAPQHVGYSYQHAVGGATVLSLEHRELASAADQMVILGDSTPIFANGTFLPDRVHAQASRNHDGEGQNVLYLDAHVDWADRPTVGVGGDNIFLVDGVTHYDGDEVPAAVTDTFLLPAFAGGR